MAWKKPSEELSKFLDERISAFEKFHELLNCSYDHVLSLPAKQKKKK